MQRTYQGLVDWKKNTTGHQNSDIFESRGGYSRVLIRRHIFTPVPKDRLVWLAIINGVFREKLFSILTMEVLVKALSLKKSDFMMIIVNRNSSCCDFADFQCMKIFSMILSLLLAKLSSGPLVCTQCSKKSTVSFVYVKGSAHEASSQLWIFGIRSHHFLPFVMGGQIRQQYQVNCDVALHLKRTRKLDWILNELAG